MSKEYTGFVLPAASLGGATFSVPHGTAPSAPVNGDMWTTTVGIYVRINGATVGPLIAGTIPTAGGAPVNVTSAAASAGAAATFSRSDHKHNISVAAAVTITPASSNGAGSASSLARSDHSHAITWPGATNTSATSGTAANFTVDGTWYDLGAGVSLAAGTYLFTADIRWLMQVSVGGGFLVGRLYDTTAAAVIAGSETMLIYNDNTATLRGSVSISRVITIASTRTIRVEGSRAAGATYGLAGSESDANGRTRSTVVRIY